MLQILREKAQGLMVVLAVLIAVAFVFFGFGDFFMRASGKHVAAKVGGHEVLWQTINTVMERVSEQQGGEIDKKALEHNILNNLIQREALLAAAEERGFRVGDADVAEALYEMPYFQVDGKFSKEKYLAVLGKAHYNDKEYRRELSQEILLSQWREGLMATSFATDAELKNLIGLFDQKRDFGYFVISKDTYAKYIKISPKEIKDYYEKHQSTFIKPETVSLQWVELSLGDLAEKLKVSPEEVKAYYEEHKTAYTLPERVHARHILVVAEPDNTESDKTAKKKIEAIAKEIESGASFEAVAKRNSEDTGTAAQGGDLDWFVRGQMVPEFENVAFGLRKPGSVSAPLRTQYGYHLIQLVAHKDPETRTFDSVKHLVETQLKREKAEKTFAERAELFAKLGFEHPGTLAPIAEEFGLTIAETPSFTRVGGEGIAKNPTVIKTAFSEELLKGKNSGSIEVGDNRIAIIRVKEHHAAAQETLAEAEKRIEGIMVAQRAKLDAEQAGAKIIKAMKQGEKPAKLATAWNLTWVQKNNVSRATENIDRSILTIAFESSGDELKELNKSKEGNSHSIQGNIRGYFLPDGNYLVLDLQKVTFGDWNKLKPETQKGYRQNLEGIFGQLEYISYVSEVLKKAKVKVFTKET